VEDYKQLKETFMRKFIKPLIFVFGFIGGCAAGELSEPERWEFIQQKLDRKEGKTLPELALNYSEILSRVTFLGPCAGGGIYYCWKGKVAVGKKDFVELWKLCKQCMMSFAVVIFVRYGIYGLIKYLKSNLDYKKFKEYLEHYEEYRDKTPVMLHAGFDKMYKEYKESAEPEKYLKKAAGMFIEDILKLAPDFSRFYAH
jgi:hypothetical protein